MSTENIDILLVDDDPSALFLHRRAVLKLGTPVQVEEAANGKQAFETLLSRFQSELQPPNFIFLDVNMPIIDGWEFLEEIKS